jgi:glycosyltransferase involved in cell wall biosynthesis
MNHGNRDLSQLTVLISYFNKDEYCESLALTIRAILDRDGKVVLVDDGSDLYSSKKLETILKNNEILNRICHLQTENRGSAASRNIAIQHVYTKWCIFLDGDDSILVDRLASLLVEFGSGDCDLIATKFYNQDFIILGQLPIKSENQKIIKINELKSIYENMGFWRYIYRTDFIARNRMVFLPTHQQLGIGEKYYLDDVFWLIQVATFAKSIILADDEFTFYVYEQRPVTSEIRESFRRMETRVAEATMVYLSHRKSKEKRGGIGMGERRMLERNLKHQFLDLTPRSMLEILCQALKAQYSIFGVSRLGQVILGSTKLIYRMMAKWQR